jgi:HEAT repeat protein
MPQFRRLIPHPTTTPEDVRLFAASQGWVYHGTRAGQSTPTVAHLWTPPDGKTVITLVEDRAIALRYMTVRGEAAAEAETAVRDGLPILRKEEVLGIYNTASTPEETVGALQILGAFANDYDSDLADALARAFHDETPQVRRAAIFAALYTEWREIEEPLVRLAADDPDDDVREKARIALESLRPIWSRENA